MMRVTCMQLKQRFTNLKQRVTKVGRIFVQKAYQKILQKMKMVLENGSLNGTAYDFSVENSSIKKEDILNIHQYLIIKNNRK